MIDHASAMALLLAAIAGFSTMIGAIIVVLTGGKSERLTSIALGFASGVMISIAFMDMLPEAEEFFGMMQDGTTSKLFCMLFLCLGVLLAALADSLIPHHCGHEHGHHHDHDECCEHVQSSHKEHMARLGIVTMIATGLHNVPEGIAMFVAGYGDISLGITLAVAVALHNIPGGITVALPVYYATGSRLKALGYALVPSVIQPLAALLACLFLKNVMNGAAMGALFALVGGFLLFMALEELYPMSKQYGYKKASTVALFVGIVIMPIINVID